LKIACGLLISRLICSCGSALLGGLRDGKYNRDLDDLQREVSERNGEDVVTDKGATKIKEDFNAEDARKERRTVSSCLRPLRFLR